MADPPKTDLEIADSPRVDSDEAESPRADGPKIPPDQQAITAQLISFFDDPKFTTDDAAASRAVDWLVTQATGMDGTMLRDFLWDTWNSVLDITKGSISHG